MKKSMSSSAVPPALRCRKLREHALGVGVYKVLLRKAAPIVNGASTAAAAPSDMRIIKHQQHVTQGFQVVATIEAVEGCGPPCAIVTPRKGFEVEAEWPGAGRQPETATLSVGIKRALHCEAKLTFDKRVCVVFDSAATSTATTDLPDLAVLREEPLPTAFDGDVRRASAPKPPGLVQEGARETGRRKRGHGEAAGNGAGDAGERSHAVATPISSLTRSRRGDDGSNSAAAAASSFAPSHGSMAGPLIDSAPSRNSSTGSLPGSAAASYATPGGHDSQARDGEKAAAGVKDSVAGAGEAPPQVLSHKVERGRWRGRGTGRGRPRGSKAREAMPQPRTTVSPKKSTARRTTSADSRSARGRGRGLGEEAGAAAGAREETVSQPASCPVKGPASRSPPSRMDSDLSSHSGQGPTQEISRELPAAVMAASSRRESSGLSGSSYSDEDSRGRRTQPEQPDPSRLRPRSEGDDAEARGSKEEVLPKSVTGTGPAPRAVTSDRATTVEQAPDDGDVGGPTGDDVNKAASSPTLGDDTKADDTGGGGSGTAILPGEDWVCVRCTLLNDEKQARCGACWAVRPREEYHLRRSRPAVPRFVEYQAARRVRQRNNAPVRSSSPAGTMGAQGGGEGLSRDGVEEKANGATELSTHAPTSRYTADGLRNKVVWEGSADVTSADRGDPLSRAQVLLMFVEWASTPAPPCTLDVWALAEQAAREVEGTQHLPSKEPGPSERGAGSGSDRDSAAGTIPSRKRKSAASRSLIEEGQDKRRRLRGNDGPKGGGIVEGTEVGDDLSDKDMEVDQAAVESSKALAESCPGAPGQNGSGAGRPSPAEGCTSTPNGKECEDERFLGPERDGNGDGEEAEGGGYRERFADDDDDEETELENDVSVGSVDY